MPKHERVPKVEMADGPGGRKGHTYIKNRKNRLERRKAKQHPDCTPTYRRYRGYEY